MNQLTMGLLVALGLVKFFLYTENNKIKENKINIE